MARTNYAVLTSSAAGRARPPFLRPLGALAVDDRRARARLPSRLLAHRHIERVMDALQCAIPGPQVEIGPYCTVLFGGRSLGSAIGSRSTARRKFRSKSRARRSCACGRRAWPVGPWARQPPIRRQSDHPDNEDHCGRQQCDVQASTSGAPPSRIKRQHRITTDSSDSTTSWIGSKMIEVEPRTCFREELRQVGGRRPLSLIRRRKVLSSERKPSHSAYASHDREP
jgi:hypothetical protein